jgi:hypothetical protein
MTAFVQTLRSGLIWMALLVVLPGVLYAMAEVPDDDKTNGTSHPPTCGVCRDHRGTHLPNVIDDHNVYVLSPGELEKVSVN